MQLGLTVLGIVLGVTVVLGVVGCLIDRGAFGQTRGEGR